jgi:hypothetical protein
VVSLVFCHLLTQRFLAVWVLKMIQQKLNDCFEKSSQNSVSACIGLMWSFLFLDYLSFPSVLPTNCVELFLYGRGSCFFGRFIVIWPLFVEIQYHACVVHVSRHLGRFLFNF